MAISNLLDLIFLCVKKIFEPITFTLWVGCVYQCAVERLAIDVCELYNTYSIGSIIITYINYCSILRDNLFVIEIPRSYLAKKILHHPWIKTQLLCGWNTSGEQEKNLNQRNQLYQSRRSARIPSCHKKKDLLAEGWELRDQGSMGG